MLVTGSAASVKEADTQVGTEAEDGTEAEQEDRDRGRRSLGARLPGRLLDGRQP